MISECEQAIEVEQRTTTSGWPIDPRAFMKPRRQQPDGLNEPYDIPTSHRPEEQEAFDEHARPQPVSQSTSEQTALCYQSLTREQLVAFRHADSCWCLCAPNAVEVASPPRRPAGWRGGSAVRPVVLILTHPADVHADDVAVQLDPQAEVHRPDTPELAGMAVTLNVAYSKAGSRLWGHVGELAFWGITDSAAEFGSGGEGVVEALEMAGPGCW